MDAFIFKLNSSGSSVVYSTYLGGTSSDRGNNIAVDQDNNVYVAGFTWSSDFPSINAKYPALWGYIDAFIFKLNANGSDVVYSTFLGGSATIDPGYTEYPTGLAVDDEGNAYVTGVTNSDDFPMVNALYSSYRGGDTDSFIFKLNNDGSDVIYSTYLGGNGDDFAVDIAVDNSGYAYVVGHTYSENFPLVNAKNYSSYFGFILKLNGSGSDIIYSTTLGETGTTLTAPVNGVAVDSEGNAYVTGWAASYDYPSTTCIPWNHGENYDYDAFVTKYSSNGQKILFSTLFGGTSKDYGAAIALDPSGNVYVTGVTESDDFPVDNGKYTNLWGSSDAFITKFEIPDGFETSTRFVFSNTPDQTVDTEFTVTLSALDNCNNYTYINGNVELSSLLGRTNPERISLVNGYWSGNITLYNWGTTSLIADGLGMTGESNTFTVAGSGSCSGNIIGKVVNKNNTPIPDALVELEDIQQGTLLASMQTDSNGNFAFMDETCDRYGITISKGDVNTGGEEQIAYNSQSDTKTYTLDFRLPSDNPAVILIPGMLGSTINPHGYYPYPLLSKEKKKHNLYIHLAGLTGFEKLKETLKENFNIFECPWDWRLEVKEAAEEYLKPKITEALEKTTTGKVHIVAHSMGGLVVRSLIQNSQEWADKIDRFAMVGTPNLGSCNAYYIWEGGDPILIDNITDSGLKSGIDYYTNSIARLWAWTYNKPFWLNTRHKAIRKFVIDKAPSLLELMYTEDFLEKDGVPLSGTTGENINTTLTRLNQDSNRYRMSGDGAGDTIETGLFIGKKSDSTVTIVEVNDPEEGAETWQDG
ncbi:MAG: hypothetical protein D3910_08315, partial [Candidatus Electrothrix sp. ATG2]|nr:hypothetical protein [Candidatus Electrothrix sp. ATG2]